MIAEIKTKQLKGGWQAYVDFSYYRAHAATEEASVRILIEELHLKTTKNPADEPKRSYNS